MTDSDPDETTPRPVHRWSSTNQPINRVGGRPEGYRGLAKLIRDKSLGGGVMVNYLLGLVLGHSMNADGTIDKSGKKPGHRERIAAAAILLDRGWGKPVGTELLLTASADGAPLETQRLASEALESIARSLASPPSQATIEGTKDLVPADSSTESLEDFDEDA